MSLGSAEAQWVNSLLGSPAAREYCIYFCSSFPLRTWEAVGYGSSSWVHTTHVRDQVAGFWMEPGPKPGPCGLWGSESVADARFSLSLTHSSFQMEGKDTGRQP